MSEKKREYVYFTLNERRKELLQKAYKIDLVKGLDNNALLEKLLDIFTTNPAAFIEESNEYKDIEALHELLSLYGNTIQQILQSQEQLMKKMLVVEEKLNAIVGPSNPEIKKGDDLFDDID